MHQDKTDDGANFVRLQVEPLLEALEPLKDGEKLIVFVRHAESTNNVSKRNFKQTVRRGRWPNCQQWGSILTMLRIPMDTPLSQRGKDQVHAQRGVLAGDGFLGEAGLEVVLHSTLQRAAETARILFQDEPGLLLQKDKLLIEKTIAEHTCLDVKQRTATVGEMLRKRPEDRLGIVSHSGLARALLGMPRRPNNVSVWVAVLKTESESDAMSADGAFRAVTEIYSGWNPQEQVQDDSGDLLLERKQDGAIGIQGLRAVLGRTTS